MSTSKTKKRIQTIISEEHYGLLQKLTDRYGKMNHVIEKGIDLINEQEDPSIHQCESTDILNLQQQMMDQGYIFIQHKFITELFNNLVEGSLIKWIDTFLDHPDDAANPLYSKLTLKNDFPSLLYYLEQESEYNQLYLTVFFDESQKTITIEPLILNSIPDIIGLLIYRSLLFLNFTFDITIGNTNLEIKWIPESDFSEKLRSRHKLQFYNRFNLIYDTYNPINYWLTNKSPAKGLSYAEKRRIQKKFLNFIVELNMYDWKEGNFISKNSGRMILLPEKIVSNLITDSKSAKDLGDTLFTPILQNLGENFTDKLERKLKMLFEYAWGIGNIEFHHEKEDYFFLTNNLAINCELIPDLLSSSFEEFDISIEKDTCIKTGANNCRYNLKALTQVILLVDDQEDVLDALNREFQRFKSLSAEILKATSAKEALKILKSHDKPINIIIADQQLTDSNMRQKKGEIATGVELFNQVKKNYPQIRRVLITGYGDTPGLIEKAINEAEVEFFLKKPWDRRTLAKAVGLDF
ncbi:MAG: response regulator [Candidatus Hodarchaeales archaeon]|jgi:ActR/RegA family two-component response regulator